MSPPPDRISAILAILIVIAMVAFAIGGDRSNDKAWKMMTDRIGPWFGVEAEAGKKKDAG